MRLRFPLLFLLSLILSACATTPAADDTLTVSIGALVYPTRAIAGDVDINVLTPAGASPETYQPTPQQMATLSDSRAYIRVGTLGFERTQLQRLTDNAPHLALIDASTGIAPITDDDHHHDGGDPHTWTSVGNMKTLAQNICHGLCALDSAPQDVYARRLDSLEQHLDSLDADFRRRLSPLRGTAFLIYHPALAYFARDYGLTQLSVERDGKAPTAESLTRLIDECRHHGVRTVFIQKEYSGQAARLIAQEIGATVVVINPLAEDWEQEMRHIVDALTAQ